VTDATANLDAEQHDPAFVRLLEAAAQLQERVPDTVMVGGSAAALYAQHRFSVDHDHTLADLAARYEQVLEAVESSSGWATSIRGTPPLTILGMEAGFEAGIRQLRRTRPLETAQLKLPSGRLLTVPTADETLRIKAYLIVNRNQMRDYLDVAALADKTTVRHAGDVLRRIDGYYTERTGQGEAVSTVLAQRLVVAEPKDKAALRDLFRYKGLASRWRDWRNVQAVCRELAQEMAR
jgi:hypothetical protein